jgi:hypothetical protein
MLWVLLWGIAVAIACIFWGRPGRGLYLFGLLHYGLTELSMVVGAVVYVPVALASLLTPAPVRRWWVRKALEARFTYHY